MAKFIISEKEAFSFDVEGKTNKEILDALKEAGFSMGKTSLSNLLNGNVKSACAFYIEDAAPVAGSATPDPVPAPVEEKAPEPVVETPKEADPAPAPVVEEPVQEVKVPATINFTDMLTQKVTTVKAQVGLIPPTPADGGDVQQDPAAPTVDSSKPKIKPLRRGTKNETIYKMLCDGATVKEICAATGWSEGAVSSVVYWDPADKGYELIKEKVEGRGNVVYLALAGAKIKADQIIYKG